jgi:hypothetical protein
MPNHEAPELDLAIVGIIPARYGSARPPGTPLSHILGRASIGRAHPRVPNPGLLRIDEPAPRGPAGPAEVGPGADVHAPEALERGQPPTRASEKGSVA